MQQGSFVGLFHFHSAEISTVIGCISFFQNWMATKTLRYYSALDFTQITLSLEACFKNKH